MKLMNKNILRQAMMRSAISNETMQEAVKHFKGQGGTLNVPELKKWLTEELNVPAAQAEQLVNVYFRNLMQQAREQKTKERTEKLKGHVEKALGDIAKPVLPPLPAVPSRASSYRSRIVKNSAIRNLRIKRASIDPINASFGEKVDVILDYVAKFPSALAAAKALIEEAKKLSSMLGKENTQTSVASIRINKSAASASGIVSKINDGLWILTALMAMGAAGTMDYIEKVGVKNAEGLSSTKSFLAFLITLGAAILSNVLYKFIIDRKKNETPRKKLYEGFNK